MSFKVYTVSSTEQVYGPIFLVRADHEQHARDLVRDVWGKAAFQAKLRDGETEHALVDSARSYAEGRVLPLLLSDKSSMNFNISYTQHELHAIESTQTVRLTLRHIQFKAENKVNLITAMAEESKLARAYRRHRKILEEWVGE